jgi:hypothetical protein
MFVSGLTPLSGRLHNHIYPDLFPFLPRHLGFCSVYMWFCYMSPRFVAIPATRCHTALVTFTQLHIYSTQCYTTTHLHIYILSIILFVVGSSRQLLSHVLSPSSPLSSVTSCEDNLLLLSSSSLCPPPPPCPPDRRCILCRVRRFCSPSCPLGPLRSRLALGLGWGLRLGMRLGMRSFPRLRLGPPGPDIPSGPRCHDPIYLVGNLWWGLRLGLRAFPGLRLFLSWVPSIVLYGSPFCSAGKVITNLGLQPVPCNWDYSY